MVGHFFPNGLKSKAYKALAFLFWHDGVPPVIVCDDANEMIEGEINRKHKDSLCHLEKLNHLPHEEMQQK